MPPGRYGANTQQGSGSTRRRNRKGKRKRGSSQQTGAGLPSTSTSPNAPRPNAPPPAAQGFTSPQAEAQPYDPQWEANKIAGGRTLAVGAARDVYDQAQLDQTFGFGAGGAANPYSRAALLQEEFQRSRRGTTNSMRGQGQLDSGAYGRAQNENQRNYDIGYDQTRREYDAATADIGFGALDRQAQYGIGTSQGDFDALLASIAARYKT